MNGIADISFFESLQNNACGPVASPMAYFNSAVPVANDGINLAQKRPYAGQGVPEAAQKAMNTITELLDMQKTFINMSGYGIFSQRAQRMVHDKIIGGITELIEKFVSLNPKAYYRDAVFAVQKMVDNGEIDDQILRAYVRQGMMPEKWLTATGLDKVLSEDYIASAKTKIRPKSAGSKWIGKTMIKAGDNSTAKQESLR